MKPLTNAVNRRLSIQMAAAFLSAAYIASRLLGLVRDRLLAAHFGIGPTVDAYTAAFRLPDLLFTLLVSGGFAVAFIPIVTRHLQAEERERAWELTAGLLNFLALATLVGSAVIFVAADPLMKLIAPGFDPQRHDLAVHLTRIMCITPVFFAISSVLGAFQQSVRRFVIYSASGALYNVGIILGILFLVPSLSIDGVAYGVLIGAALQAAFQIIGLSGLGFKWRRTLGTRDPSARRVLGLMVPRSLDEGIDQFNYVIETVIGSGLGAGSLTALYYANNLKNVPLVIFGGATATAAFPALSAAADDWPKLISRFVQTARFMLFMVIPAVVVVVLMRGYIVRLLFGFGNSTTANTLGWFAGTILFGSLFYLVARMFYALGDTKTPLYTSMVAVLLNVGASVLLSRHFGVVGLAMAQSLVITLEVLALLALLRRRLGHLGLRSVVRGLMVMALGATVMAGVIYLMVARLLPLYTADRGIETVGLKFAIVALAGAGAYVLPCYFLGLDEAREVWQRLRRSMRRAG